MSDKTKIFFNPQISFELTGTFPTGDSFAFHKKLPGYQQSRLISAPSIAAKLGVANVWVKDESNRFGLPAFKFLGASWAIYKTLLKKSGGNIEPWNTFKDLQQRFSMLKPLTLLAATDGNHGRAVARMAKLLGFDAHIFVPQNMVRARIDDIRDEGAKVTIIDGSYDNTVAKAAQEASEKNLVISDTAWEGYTEVPRWIMEGYTTIFNEIDEQLGDTQIDLIPIQIGVGGLATTAVWHYKQPELQHTPKIMGVEPLLADCVLESMQAGHIIEVFGPHTSIMAGLNCGIPSLVAWPTLSKGVDVFIAIEDVYAKEAMKELAKVGLVSGETGAAGLAGLLALLRGSGAEKNRKLLNLSPSSNVVIISTEGATDPEAYKQIVSQS
ncbi:MAG TPA: diaminopropionate ammonia-lyase [Candidatus Saccharimonadales bacterium]|nr:diaminopropionate ammonia-lyase [Candidatus Saccharimonadales bacterium]